MAQKRVSVGVSAFRVSFCAALSLSTNTQTMKRPQKRTKRPAHFDKFNKYKQQNMVESTHNEVRHNPGSKTSAFLPMTMQTIISQQTEQTQNEKRSTRCSFAREQRTTTQTTNTAETNAKQSTHTSLQAKRCTFSIGHYTKTQDIDDKHREMQALREKSVSHARPY